MFPNLGGCVHPTVSHRCCYLLSAPWPTPKAIAVISLSPGSVYSRSWRPSGVSHMLMNMFVSAFAAPHWEPYLFSNFLLSTAFKAWHFEELFELIFQIFAIPFSRRVPGQGDLHASRFPNLIAKIDYVSHTTLWWICHSASTCWSFMEHKARNKDKQRVS